MTNLNNLTMKELSKIAKDEYNLPLSVTIEGKRKRFNKPELIEMIELEIIKRDPIVKEFPSVLDFGDRKGSPLNSNITIGKAKSNTYAGIYGSAVSVETIQNEIAPLELMVNYSKDHLKFGDHETVLKYVDHLKNEIKESNNSLLINKMSKVLLILKSLLIVNKVEVKF